MKLTNSQIISSLNKISEAFFTEEAKSRYFPIKLNFAIQKNITILLQHNAIVDASRKRICEHYGTLEGNQYVFDTKEVDAVNKELQDLYNIETDLPILTVSLNTIEHIELTPAQMDAIMFMIEE